MAKEGKRLLHTCHIATSANRLLAVLRDEQPKPAERCRFVGIDDFALRKGIACGTVVVDLETRRPLDLPPDRTVQTVSAWLTRHPEIEVVSRGRWAEYERGVTQGAPQATQVMDRWHVIKNLREALERQLRRSQ